MHSYIYVFHKLLKQTYQNKRNYDNVIRRAFCSISSNLESEMRFLNQEESIKIDQELFEVYKFSVDQLMEQVGLFCAQVVAKTYPEKEKKILVCVGPGNNGGDGLVCSRHLKQFGFSPEVLYPKRVDKPLYNNLFTQCELYDVPILSSMPTLDVLKRDYSVIVDALFGFSFKPPARPLFLPILENLSRTDIPIVSIDIPSGWHVEDGPKDLPPDTVFHPDTLISCTAPKLCAHHFSGRFHYLAGRFVPARMCQMYSLNLPEFPKAECYVLLNKN